MRTEDEKVGWLHRLNGPEFEQTPGDGEGQGNLAGHDLATEKQGHHTLDTCPGQTWTQVE